MEQKAKIIDRYSVEIIDYDDERARLEHRSMQLFEVLLGGDIANLDSGFETLCYEREFAIMELDEYLPFQPTEPPAVDESTVAIPYYEAESGTVVQRWEAEQNSPIQLATQIATLQSQLAATDYRVTKAYEYSLIGEPSPYDLVELHSSRQLLRNRINDLSAKLKMSTNLQLFSDSVILK